MTTTNAITFEFSTVMTSTYYPDQPLVVALVETGQAEKVRLTTWVGEWNGMRSWIPGRYTYEAALRTAMESGYTVLIDNFTVRTAKLPRTYKAFPPAHRATWLPLDAVRKTIEYLQTANMI